MDRENHPGSGEHEADVKDVDARLAENDHRCMLCDVIIEHDEYDIFFVTGHCRFCDEALNDNDENAK